MSKKSVTDEGRLQKNAILSLFVGRRLGKGAYRRVYDLKIADETLVIKLEYCGTEFCNITEWKVWNEVKDTPLEEWFAPCEDIDLLGLALIQKKTKPFDSEKEFRDAVLQTRDGVLPTFFDDVHYGNFGMLDGKVVCHDYGFNNFLSEAVKMKWGDLAWKHNGTTAKTPQEDQLELPL